MPETVTLTGWEDEQKEGPCRRRDHTRGRNRTRGNLSKEGKPHLRHSGNHKPVKGRHQGEEEGEGQSVPAPNVSKRLESHGCPAHLAQNSQGVCSLPWMSLVIVSKLLINHVFPWVGTQTTPCLGKGIMQGLVRLMRVGNG